MRIITENKVNILQDDFKTEPEEATEELEKIREAALRILEHADNTSGDLRRKLLKKGYRQEAVEQVIARLSEADLLNDLRFAEHYTRSKTESGKGPAWIRRKLEEKGIPQGVVEQVLEEVSDQSGERRRCLLRALDFCGLKYDFDVDHHGNLLPVEGSSVEYGTAKVFERNVRTEPNRVNIYREREKAKAKMIRRLSSAGFSQDAVMFAVRKIGDL